MQETYHVVTALLLVAALVGAFALQLRQPLIVAFIVTGILVGPAVLDWVGRVLGLRSGRESADRDGDHGLHGIPAANRFHGRAHGGADQRILDRVRRDGDVAGARRQCGAQPDHAGRTAPDRGVDVHDPVFAAAVGGDRAMAVGLRAKDPVPRAPVRDRADGP